jgi:hypothetical protein
MRTALLTLAAVVLTAATARADVIGPPPPPPPPPPGEMVAKVAAGSALGFAVMGLGLWLARRNRKAVAA